MQKGPIFTHSNRFFTQIYEAVELDSNLTAPTSFPLDFTFERSLPPKGMVDNHCTDHSQEATLNRTP